VKNPPLKRSLNIEIRMIGISVFLGGPMQSLLVYVEQNTDRRKSLAILRLRRRLHTPSGPPPRNACQNLVPPLTFPGPKAMSDNKAKAVEAKVPYLFVVLFRFGIFSSCRQFFWGVKSRGLLFGAVLPYLV
jgi:hypothetical protein